MEGPFKRSLDDRPTRSDDRDGTNGPVQRPAGIENFIPRDGILGIVFLPLLATIRIFLRVQALAVRILFSVELSATWLLSSLINGWLTGRVLRFILPFQLWCFLSGLVGKEEQLSTAGRLTPRTNETDDLGIGKDLENFVGNIVGNVLGGLGRIKDEHEAAVDAFSQDNQAERTHRNMEKRDAPGGTSRDGLHFDNMAENIRAPLDSSLNAENGALFGGRPSNSVKKWDRSEEPIMEENFNENPSEVFNPNISATVDETVERVHASGEALLSEFHQRIADRKAKLKDLLPL